MVNEFYFTVLLSYIFSCKALSFFLLNLTFLYLFKLLNVNLWNLEMLFLPRLSPRLTHSLVSFLTLVGEQHAAVGSVSCADVTLQSELWWIFQSKKKSLQLFERWRRWKCDSVKPEGCLDLLTIMKPGTSSSPSSSSSCLTQSQIL